jgi:hypothetical protein
MFKVMRNGLELRRGYYQYATTSFVCCDILTLPPPSSVRPALGKMIVTIDTTAAAL